MAKRCLIVFQSRSGNTAKVADRFKTVFERSGWTCDLFNINKKTDILNPPFDFKNYDFVCLGSGINMHEPYREILALVRSRFFGFDSRILYQSGEEGHPFGIERPTTPDGKKVPTNRHGKIIIPSEAPKAVVFVTYSGFEFGPKEAEPALHLLELEIEHLKFRCLGRFSCPGKMGNQPKPWAYHKDIHERPNEKDLMRAEMFIEDKLEEIS